MCAVSIADGQVVSAGLAPLVIDRGKVALAATRQIVNQVGEACAAEKFRQSAAVKYYTTLNILGLQAQQASVLLN